MANLAATSSSILKHASRLQESGKAWLSEDKVIEINSLQIRSANKWLARGTPMTTYSMTGFASASGTREGWSWTWEIRSVNGRGLDLRLRLPDWIDGLEAETRAAFKGRVARGNVTVNLRVKAESEQGVAALNTDGLAAAFDVLKGIEDAAKQHGLRVSPLSAVDVAEMRGVVDSSSSEDDIGPLKAVLLESLDTGLADFHATRAEEGQALFGILSDQVDRIADLAQLAKELADARSARAPGVLEAAIERITQVTDAVNPERLAQELALIAVKSDVTEELDRLSAHVASARELLASADAKGRKLDFLMQEFNREANTLCSKSGDADLTRVGLDLKAVIDQMREQVQNVE